MLCCGIQECKLISSPSLRTPNSATYPSGRTCHVHFLNTSKILSSSPLLSRHLEGLAYILSSLHCFFCPVNRESYLQKFKSDHHHLPVSFATFQLEPIQTILRQPISFNYRFILGLGESRVEEKKQQLWVTPIQPMRA